MDFKCTFGNAMYVNMCDIVKVVLAGKNLFGGNTNEFVAELI